MDARHEKPPPSPSQRPAPQIDGFEPSVQVRRRDEIHEEPDARRDRPAGLERGEEMDFVAPVVSKAFNKAFGLQVPRNVPQRLQR